MTKDGYSTDPSNSDALAAIDKPKTAGELCDFVDFLRWMKITISNFPERISKLNEVLESAYSRSGKKTKRSIKDMNLQSFSWGTEHEKLFTELQENLCSTVQLAHLDEDK